MRFNYSKWFEIFLFHRNRQCNRLFPVYVELETNKMPGKFKRGKKTAILNFLQFQLVWRKKNINVSLHSPIPAVSLWRIFASVNLLLNGAACSLNDMNPFKNCVRSQKRAFAKEIDEWQVSKWEKRFPVNVLHRLINSWARPWSIEPFDHKPQSVTQHWFLMISITTGRIDENMFDYNSWN